MSQQVVIAGPGIPQALGLGDSPTFSGLIVDTDTLFVDSVNHRLGINTLLPAAALHVVGDSIYAGSFRMLSNANHMLLDTAAGSSRARLAASQLTGISDAYCTVEVLNTVATAFDEALRLDGGGIATFGFGETVAREVRITNTDDGSGNTEFLSIGYKNTPNVLTIESEATGTGTVRDIEIVSANFLLGGDPLGNIWFGNSLQSITTGINNVGQGLNALLSNTTGSNNSAQGSNTLRDNTAGKDNSAQGANSLKVNITGTSNSAQGVKSLGSNTSGFNNSAQGFQTLFFNTAGARLTAVGAEAGLSNTTGNNNVFMGYRAGDNITSGSSNLIFGYDIDAPSATASNQMSIGNLLFSEGVDGTGTTVSTGNIGVATPTPIGRFAIGGDNARPFTIQKSTVAVVAPTAGHGMLRWEVGTNAGTLKVVAYSGTSTTGVTIADNIGAGN